MIEHPLYTGMGVPVMRYTDEVQSWIRNCLRVLPLCFFTTFDGVFLSEITATLAEEVRSQVWHFQKLYACLNYSFDLAVGEGNGAACGVTRPSRINLLAYWILQAVRMRDLPDSWLDELARREEWHDLIIWDASAQDSHLPFAQKYYQQKTLIRPTKTEVEKMDPEAMAFRDAVLKVKVSGACAVGGLTYGFPFSMNISSTQLKEHFASRSIPREKTDSGPQDRVASKKECERLAGPTEVHLQSEKPQILSLPNTNSSESIQFSMDKTRIPEQEARETHIRISAAGGREDKIAKSTVPREEPASPATSAKTRKELAERKLGLIASDLNDPKFPGIDQAIAIIRKDVPQTVLNDKNELERELGWLTARGIQKLWALCFRVVPGFGDSEETGNDETPTEESSTKAADSTPANNTSLSATAKDGSGGVSQSGPDSDASLSSTLEDLHVYLAKQESLIKKLEQRCDAIEASHKSGVRKLEQRHGAAEKVSRSRIVALELQVKGLIAEISGLKRGGTPASAPGLANFLKRKRNEE